MPELIEELYCSQQIVIPPKFPYILKQYAKSAIKTQPYDLLRWSYEYFKALSEGKKPPVKLRIEYPIYATEGGLTRGYLKVLAHQLEGLTSIPLDTLRNLWKGACLDPQELTRILCLCSVYKRCSHIHYLNFFAVASALLTKNVTNTMNLACETLTKEPDGGSAAIPAEHFVQMYVLLAQIDASKPLRYINGYIEGYEHSVRTTICEGEGEEGDDIEDTPVTISSTDTKDKDDENESQEELLHLSLIDDKMATTTNVSRRVGSYKIMEGFERSPSVQRAAQIERENYLRMRKERAVQNKDIDDKLREMSGSEIVDEAVPGTDSSKDVGTTKQLEINVFDEEGNPALVEIYGEKPRQSDKLGAEESKTEPDTYNDDHYSDTRLEEGEDEKEEVVETDPVKLERQKVQKFINDCFESQLERQQDLADTFEELTEIVDRFKMTNYDLSMVAGRQMSTTSGEFVVQYIEKEILSNVDEQIAILPDPVLKKRKARPEEVEMIGDLILDLLDDAMDVIVADLEDLEEEEAAIPEITVICPIPGIGPVIEELIVREFCDYVNECAAAQSGLFMPRNMRYFLCPPLERFPENIEEDLGTEHYQSFNDFTKEHTVPVVD